MIDQGLQNGRCVDEAQAPGPDPYKFDLADFAIDPHEVEGPPQDGGVIAIGRPGPQVFFRAKPGFRVFAPVIELKDGGEGTFVLSKAIAKDFEEETKLKELRLLQTRFGGFLIYPVGLPDHDGRLNTWTASARLAVQAAEAQWVRMVSDRAVGQYIVRPAKDQGAMPDVRWPEISDQEVMERAFGTGNLIVTRDHPVLLRLQGSRGA